MKKWIAASLAILALWIATPQEEVHAAAIGACCQCQAFIDEEGGVIHYGCPCTSDTGGVRCEINAVSCVVVGSCP